MSSTKYHSFNVFMEEVIHQANEQVDLEDLFELKNMAVLEIMKQLISRGWWVFIAVVGLLVLGPAGFAIALVTFLTSPPGIIVGVIFGATAIASVRTLYQDRKLPLAVREVGREFQSRWESVEGNHNRVDALLEEAVDSLISKARQSQRELLN